jgi:hypothetical protein
MQHSPLRPGGHEQITRAFVGELSALRDLIGREGAGGVDEGAGVTLALCRLMFDTFIGEAGSAYGQLGNDDIARARALFARYPWRLDGAGAGEAAITPDALCAFFERSLDRKPSGAYYTQADVADYIARATIVPLVLEEAARLCPQRFGPHGSAWRLLGADPDRYVPPEMHHGAEQPLPQTIAAGLGDPAARGAWDAPAPASHGLARETWREALGRHARYQLVREQIARGGITTPADLVTHNLDMLRFALDAADGCEEAGELRALWQAVSRVAILDPTCGAGAFLVAAARVLEPLYLACLSRAAAFPCDETLRGVADSSTAGRRRWAAGAIVRNNLHGVDLMPEAVEVCRMRLALEAAASGADALAAREALARTIRSGDALLGPVGAGSAHGGAAGGLDWPAAFPEIMGRGGFDAVIGNPPYVAVGDRRAYAALGYTTAAGGNLYALVVERALALLRSGGRLGVIVPIASVSTDGMRALQALYAPHEQWHSHYAVRPARLFDGVDMNLTITLLRKAPGERYVGGYRRWSSGPRGERRHLFGTLGYTTNARLAGSASGYPKLGTPLEAAILERMLAAGYRLRDYVDVSGVTLYYHSGGRYWRKALPVKLSSHYKPVTVAAEVAPVIFGLLNSQLFYWYWIVNSNCMDLVAREVLELPVFPLERAEALRFAALQEELLAAYDAGRSVRSRHGARIRVDEANFSVRAARPVIDRIDDLLAAGYELDAEQLDFIRGYDLKYRAGLLRAPLR